MSIPTRSNCDHSLLEVSNSERILRCRRGIATNENEGDVTPAQEGQRGNTPEGNDNLWDSNTYMGPIPDLYMPDLNNTPLRIAIEKGMALNNNETEYMILCPRLKQHIGMDRLRVEIPSGKLEVDMEPYPIGFIADCAEIPFDQERTLIDAMEGLKRRYPELIPLPGEDFCVHGKLMKCRDVHERLEAYCTLGTKYGQCCISWEAAQLNPDIDTRNREEYYHQVLMNRISNILDMINNSFIKDNTLRKRHKKVTFPLPRLNPRVTTFTTVEQVTETQNALEDEMANIMQIAFKPQDQDTEGAHAEGAHPTREGDDIPNDTNGRQRNRTTNIHPTNTTQDQHSSK